jgi:hypothetical protein
MIKESVAVGLRNVTQMEINAVRAFFTESMDAFYRLTPEEAA